LIVLIDHAHLRLNAKHSADQAKAQAFARSPQMRSVCRVGAQDVFKKNKTNEAKAINRKRFAPASTSFSLNRLLVGLDCP
jgi:hypothetical protein